MGKNVYRIQAGDTALFNNNVCFCIGTGRMGLALQQEKLEERTEFGAPKPLQAVCALFSQTEV